MDFTPEVVALASLRPHPRNYREHPEDQLAHLVASIREHGFFRNVVVAKDGTTILAGHGIVKAAARLSLTEIPVVRLPIEADSAAALKVIAADNEIGRLADIDDRALTAILRDIKDTDSLLGTGFDEKQLAALVMVTRPAAEIADIDEAAEWVGMPGFGEAPSKITVVIQFEKPEDRLAWIARIEELTGEKMKMHYKAEGAWSTWYPPKERDDLQSVRFEPEAASAP